MKCIDQEPIIDEGIITKVEKIDWKQQVLNELESMNYAYLGNYERVYPDNTSAISKGDFVVEINRAIMKGSMFVDIDLKADEEVLDFDIENFGKEKKMKEGWHDLEGNEAHNYFNEIENELKKTLMEEFEIFLDKFKTREDICNYLFAKKNFLKKNDPLIGTYDILKEDLPDGMDFEEFSEQIHKIKIMEE